MPTWCWDPRSDLQVRPQVLRWVQRGSGEPGHRGAQTGGLEDGPIRGPNSGRASLAPAGQPALHARRAAGEPAVQGSTSPSWWDPEVRGTHLGGGPHIRAESGRSALSCKACPSRQARPVPAKSGWQGPRGHWWEQRPSSGLLLEWLPSSSQSPPAPAPRLSPRRPHLRASPRSPPPWAWRPLVI